MIFERESRWRDIPAIILAVLHYTSCHGDLHDGSRGSGVRHFTIRLMWVPIAMFTHQYWRDLQDHPQECCGADVG